MASITPAPSASASPAPDTASQDRQDRRTAAVTAAIVRSPWAFGGPFSHDGPVPGVAGSATLGELDSLGRL